MTSPIAEEAVHDQPVQEETVQESGSPETEPSLQDQLTAFIEARTGIFEVALDLDDLKWLKNQCNSKFGFKGPNDAFMLMNAYHGLNGALENNRDKDAVTTRLTAATIEALALLINRYEGAGVVVAQRVFKVAVALQNAIARFRELDAQIEALETEIKAQDSEPESAE